MPSNPSSGNVLWALSDHLGSIRDVADRNETTGVTSITNHRRYDTFGKRIDETNSYVDLAFGYTGKYFDETTHLQNNLNRWYDPNLGKWISQDPIGFAAGDANLYRYVGNEAVAATDPGGLQEPGVIVLQPPPGGWPQKPPVNPFDPLGRGNIRLLLLPSEEAAFWADLNQRMSRLLSAPAEPTNKFAGLDIGRLGPAHMGQWLQLRSAARIAYERIASAYDTFKNDRYIVEHQIGVSGSSHARKMRESPERVLQMLKTVRGRLEREHLPVVIDWINTGDERKAYVRFYLWYRVGWRIHIVPRFFDIPEEEQVTTLMHEIGRLYLDMGETNTDSWRDAYQWDAFLRVIGDAEKYRE